MDLEKISIYENIYEYKERAKKALDICLKFALAYWRACKDDMNSTPKYLYNLNMNELLNHGHKWFEEDRKLMDLFTHQYISKPII